MYSKLGQEGALWHSSPYQHVDVMHEVQEQHGQLHDEVRVVHVGALVLPGSGVLQVPQVDGVPGSGYTSLYKVLV